MTKYSLPAIILDEAQTNFFFDAQAKAMEVELAPIGDLTALYDFIQFVNRVDAIFGEGAMESAENLSSGELTYGEATQQALLLISALIQMADAPNFLTFFNGLNKYREYYDEFLPDYLIMYNLASFPFSR